jgi:hypothetical protein
LRRQRWQIPGGSRLSASAEKSMTGLSASALKHSWICSKSRNAAGLPARFEDSQRLWQNLDGPQCACVTSREAATKSRFAGTAEKQEARVSLFSYSDAVISAILGVVVLGQALTAIQVAEAHIAYFKYGAAADRSAAETVYWQPSADCCHPDRQAQLPRLSPVTACRLAEAR